MEMPFPKTWAIVEGSDFVIDPKSDIVDGPFGSNLKASEYIDAGVPIIRIQNVKRFNFIDKNIKFISKEKYKELQRHSFVSGDILITKLGDPLGLACEVPEKYKYGIIVADLVRLHPNLQICSKSFLIYLLNSEIVIKQIEKHIKGSTRPRINLGIIRGLILPLPPLAEQKVIADKLDTLLEQVKATKARLERIREILKRFRQSVIAAAMSGMLTDEWRDSNGYSLNNWSIKKIDDISSDISYGYTASSSDLPIGPKMLRITDIQDNKVNWDDVPYCEIEEEKKKQYLLACGDLVFARTGATVGKSFLIRQAPPESVYASYLIRVRCNPTNSIEYLALFFQSNDYWNQITEVSTGIAQPSVNGTKLKNLLVPIPPLKEQSEIVRRVEKLFSFVDGIEKKANIALGHTNNLTQFILAKAFSGQLTAVWRATNPDLISGENSAEALLKKIKIEQETLKEQPRTRTVRKKKESSTIMVNKLISVLEETSDWIAAQEAFRLCGVTDGTPTERVEELYSELRSLDKAGHLQIDTVTDEQGRKLYDRLKLTGV